MTTFNYDTKIIMKKRFDMEELTVFQKIEFINKTICDLSDMSVTLVTIKLAFWESNCKIKKMMRQFNVLHLCSFIQLYDKQLKPEQPGVVHIHDIPTNSNFINQLLLSHLNFELALIPALNIRIAIEFKSQEDFYSLDIYDDRGCDLYCLSH